MWKIVFSLLAAVFVVGQGATMPGGRIDIDISDAGAQNALNFAVVQHNKGTNDLFLSQVAEVVKVQSQVSYVKCELVNVDRIVNYWI